MSGPTRDTARGSSLGRVQQEPAMARDHPRTSNLALRSSTLPSVRRSASAAAHRFNVVRDGGRRLPQARNSEHPRYMIRSAPPDDTDGEPGAPPQGAAGSRRGSCKGVSGGGAGSGLTVRGIPDDGAAGYQSRGSSEARAEVGSLGQRARGQRARTGCARAKGRCCRPPAGRT